MRHLIRIEDQLHAFWLARKPEGYVLETDDGACDVAATRRTGRTRLTVGGSTVDAVVAVDGDDVFVHVDGFTLHGRFVDPVRHRARHHGVSAEDTAAAPMPGVVVSILVEAGQAVSVGETLLVIESMKLETAIKAWRDGVVQEVHVAPGKSFDRSAALVTLATEGGD